MKKVQGRLRGFMALMLAMMIAMGFMPMQSVKAADVGPFAYYLVCYGTGSDDTQFLGSGTIDTNVITSGESSGLYYHFSRQGSNIEGNQWLNYNTSQHTWSVAQGREDILIRKSDLAEGNAAVIEVNKETPFWYGRTDSGVVIVNEARGAVRGMIRLNPGKYKITNVGDRSGDYAFTLTPATITLSETALEFTVGDPEKKLTVAPADYDVTWESTKPEVAKVSDSGEVTAVAEGETTITASLKLDPDTKATCKVTVKAAPDDKKAEEPKKDDSIKDKDGNDTGYVVANADKTNFQASYKGTAKDKKAKKVKILDEITDGNGNVFKVTEIEPEALKNAKGKELIIGKNIKKIGRKALKNAKFKKITLKTDKKGKIKIEKDAFKVKSKKCTVKIKGIKKANKQKLSNKILKQASKGVVIK